MGGYFVADRVDSVNGEDCTELLLVRFSFCALGTGTSEAALDQQQLSLLPTLDALGLVCVVRRACACDGIFLLVRGSRT